MHPVVPTYHLKFTPSHMTPCSSLLLSSVEPTPFPLVQSDDFINWAFFSSPPLLLSSFLIISLSIEKIYSASWSLISLDFLLPMNYYFLYLSSYTWIFKTPSLGELYFFLPTHLPWVLGQKSPDLPKHWPDHFVSPSFPLCLCPFLLSINPIVWILNLTPSFLPSSLN